MNKILEVTNGTILNLVKKNSRHTKLLILNLDTISKSRFINLCFMTYGMQLDFSCLKHYNNHYYKVIVRRYLHR